MPDNIFIELLWSFPIYAFFGWCMETVCTFLRSGKFVNRDFLKGPVCPIYSHGAVIMILCLTKVRNNLLVLFLCAAVICSALELIAGLVLKKVFKKTLWDYSGMPLNIGGHICLLFSLMWGVAGIMLMRVIHPFIRRIVLMAPAMLIIILLAVFYIYYIGDITVTLTILFKRKIKQADKDENKGSRFHNKAARTLTSLHNPH